MAIKPLTTTDRSNNMAGIDGGMEGDTGGGTGRGNDGGNGGRTSGGNNGDTGGGTSGGNDGDTGGGTSGGSGCKLDHLMIFCKYGMYCIIMYMYKFIQMFGAMHFSYPINRKSRLNRFGQINQQSICVLWQGSNAEPLDR